MLFAEHGDLGPVQVVARDRGPAERQYLDAERRRDCDEALAHQAAVVSAAFSPDGTRVVTASNDATAQVSDVRPDTGTLDEWAVIAERSPFVLVDGAALVRRSPPPPQEPTS